MMNLRSVLGIGFSLVLASGAIAQTADHDMPTLCFGHLMSDTIAGDYTFETGQLQVSVNGNLMYPDGPGQGTATIAAGGDDGPEFVVTGMPAPLPPIPLNQMGPDETMAELSRAPGAGLTNQDLALMWGCQLKDLPRLSGAFRTRSQDGFEIENTFQLIVLDPDWITGLWEFKAVGTRYPVSGIRTVAFSR